MQTGDTVNFGDYKWKLLRTEGSKALVITEKIIFRSSYSNIYKPMTWAECSLRDYLNGEFLLRFTSEECERIVPVVNKNDDNEWYGTEGGEDTLDSVFLLSIAEAVCHCFGDSSRLLYENSKNQRYWFERKDSNSAKRSASFGDEAWHSWWWLRSPGRVGIKAAYVHGNGDIGIQGNNILKGNIADGYCAGGVRPALWLKLE